MVCRANITRSPFFAGYLGKLIHQRSIPWLKDLQIISAGTQAAEGTPANPVIKHLARLNGFSLLHHRSQRFKRKIARRADLVLTMEENQKAAILELYPNLKGRVFTVRGFGEGEPNVPDVDIPDPTGREAEDFQAFINVTRSVAERVLHVLWAERLPQIER
ncbi:MAG: hypothetical protein LJE96_17080 [Deltaproteobacteria bacterium]|nr:hypothetical protein [Deltaproteobacteria bacterium]